MRDPDPFLSCDEPGHDGVVLEAESIVRRYGGQVVLDHVDLQIRCGECYVVMGASGSGKSQLLRHLAGLEEPDEGSVRLHGIDLHTVPEEHRPPLSMVFQSAALFNSLTVGENVGLWMTERGRPAAEVAEIVRGTLDQVGLGQVEELLPQELSGGMRKRAAIARALTIESHLIFYDEPTSELDPVTAARITELIGKLSRTLDRTTLLVTHDRDMAFYLADRIGILHEGRLIAEGDPQRIQQSDDPAVRRFLDAHVGRLASRRQT